MNTSAEVQFIYIQNPLSPVESRLNVPQPYDAARSLADYLGPLEGDWAVSISGRMIDREEWALAYLQQTDCVVVAPMIYGGGGSGGGKSVLRLVAIIAVSYFSAGAGAAMGLTGAAAAAVSIGVGIAGTMAINALLPPPKPKLPTSGASFNDSPTYGVDGPKNLSTRGIPVPVIYGESWYAGNFVQTYVDNVGDDQYLNLLLVVGEGPCQGVSDITINDQPIQNYNGVEVIWRPGTENQALMPYFNDIVRPFNRSVDLTGSYMIHTVAETVDRLRVDIVLPKGLSILDDEDGLRPYTTSFNLEIREQGGAWGPFTGGAARIYISGKRMSPMRFSYWSDVLDRNKLYEVRAAHTESDDQPNVANSITLTDVNYINFDDINYKHTAMLGLRIKLSDQLQGIPSVKYRAAGKLCPVYNPVTGSFVETFTKNPAWHCLDAMMNKRYGGGLRAERFKIDYWKQWADFCTANSLEFNGAIDQRTNLWDAIAPIQKLGRAQVVAAGTKYQVAIVRQSRPVQLFTTATIKKGSLSIDWLPQDERANEVHIGYYDKNDGGKQRTVIIPNVRARERGEEAKPTELTLYGCDNVTQANREGVLAMNMQELLRTVTFAAPLEAIVCTLGDVISLQHDMPNWGEGGLMAPGSTKSLIKLDKPVLLDQGGQYVVQVRHDKVVQATFDIEAVVGKFVVPGFGFNIINFDRFRRLLNTRTGQDYEITGGGVIDQFGRHGIMVANAAGLLVGDIIQFIDTNVIEQRLVLSEDPTIPVTQLRLATPLTEIPRTETPWAFGINEQVVTNLTVMSINRKDDLWPTISGLEYNDASYSDTVVDIKPPPINTAPIIPNVIFGGFKERRYLLGGGYTSDIEMSWESTDIMYAYAEVHISIDDEPYKLMDANATTYTLEKLNAGKINLRLVPVTIEGFKPAFGLVTTHTYVVAPGVPRTPPAPLNFRVGVVTDTVIELLWGDIDSWSASQNVYAYEIWHAPYADANPIDMQLIAITRNNHFPHVGLIHNSWHTYWIRTSNVMAGNVKSPFTPPLGLTVQCAEPQQIDYTNLDEQLREAITDASNLDGLATLITEVDAKLATLTDENRQEIFDRIEQVGVLEAHVNTTIGTLVTADEALATQMETLAVTVGEEIAAEINTVRTVIADGDEALALEINTIGVGLNDEITAAIEVERLARVTADSAVTQDVVRRVAELNDQLRAQITVESQSRVGEGTALAQQIRTLSTNVGGFRSAIQEVVESVDGISSSYSLRIDQNGIISGFGIATGSGGESEFIINATRFKICPPGLPGSAALAVFEVNTNGAMRIKNAIVGDIQSDNYISGVSGWIIKK